MNTSTRRALGLAASFALTAVLAACSSSGEAKGPEGEHDHKPGEEHGHHHHQMTGAVKDFHTVLKPVYHSDKGPARAEKACAALASFKEKAGPVVTEAKDDAAKTRAEALSTSVNVLETACAGAKDQVEAKLESLHDAFHAVMEGK